MGLLRLSTEVAAQITASYGATPANYTDFYIDSATGVPSYRTSDGVLHSLQGATGNAGRGITSVARTSGTGAAGTTDTYTITFTDAATTTFQVVNGANGAAGVSPNAFTTITGNTGTANADNAADTLAVTGTAPMSVAAADTPDSLTISIAPATATAPGSLSAAFYKFLSLFSSSTILVTANPYSNLLCDGATDDLAALNALYAAAPDGSTLVWPGQNSTMVLSGAAAVPAGKHFRHLGGGNGNKTNVLQTSPTADHFTAGDWYNTWENFNFTTNNTTTTASQALTSGTVLNVAGINTALVAASGTINVGSTVGWQTLTYSARTSTTVTLSQTGTGSSVPGIPLVFKTAGAAINAGNLVGIDARGNSFTCCYNGYVCSGSTSNQSDISNNSALNTINFNILIDGANWNGIIDSNAFDCTANSRTLSHVELLQVGSATGQGNQFIRAQYNLRLGSTTAAYPAGVFGVYFSNTFFDTAGVDSVKFQGVSAVQRIKFTSCWFSSAAQKGVNFASTATTLPTDIEFIGCNIYSNGTDGIGGSGVADYKVIGGEVAGNAANGFNIAANAGGTYSVTAVGVRIGPTGGIGANGTGVAIATGTYTQIKFANCDALGNTTAALTLGTVTVANYTRFALTDNPGINPRNAAVGPPAATPVLATTYTNTYGVRVLLMVKMGATANTAVVLNGVTNTTTFIAAQNITFTLEPGGSIQFVGGTAPTFWLWNGQ